MSNSPYFSQKKLISFLGHIIFNLWVLFWTSDLFGIPLKFDWDIVPSFVMPCGIRPQAYLRDQNSSHGGRSPSPKGKCPYNKYLSSINPISYSSTQSIIMEPLTSDIISNFANKIGHQVDQILADSQPN